MKRLLLYTDTCPVINSKLKEVVSIRVNGFLLLLLSHFPNR